MAHLSAAVHRLSIRDSALLHGDAPELLLANARAAISSGARALVIDFGGVDSRGVDFGDPREVATLSMLRQRLPPYVRVALASLTPAAQRIARVTHLYDLFDIYVDAQAAMDDLAV